ncbi:hypothetical protein BBJ28_00006290 [Nothophytophthora sp. Chile5]|nr:hypothetical protein BBJ28_00006290 [Nothophytophthora sp. Chile5]
MHPSTCSNLSTLMLVATTAVLLSSGSVSARSGYVTFFMGADFKAEDGLFKGTIRSTQECYDMPHAFNNSATSVNWKGLVQRGAFDGHAKVALYNGSDCSGAVRAWPTTEKNFPTNLALDGFNNQVSSFMIWETSKNARNGSSRNP